MGKRSGFFESALVYTVANALNASIPFLLLPVMTRAFTPEEYGTVAMFAVVLAVIGPFTGLSVHGAVGIRYFEQDRIDLPRFISTCLLILGVSTVVVLLVVAFAYPWLELFTKVPREWLLMAVVLSSARFVVQIQLSVWQAGRQPFRYGVFQVGQSALNAGLSLWFVLGMGLAWQGRLVGQALAVLAFLLVAMWTLGAGRWIKFPASREYARDALKFGVPLIPHTIGGVLIAVMDRFMISNMIDVAQAGIYTVALQVGMVLGLLTDSFNRAFAPWLIENLRREDGRRDLIVVRYTYLYFVTIALLALLMGFAAPTILAVLAGDQYQAASGVVLYIAVGFAFGGMYYMVTTYVFFVGRTGSLATITLFCGVSNVVLSYILIGRSGVVGAAQAFMLCQAALFLGTWWLAHKVRPMPWKQAILQP
jgi:O-antigen/teichoic acid export membrane protein